MKLDLEALKRKYARWEPLGDIPPNVFTDLCALIDELAETRRERDRIATKFNDLASFADDPPPREPLTTDEGEAVAAFVASSRSMWSQSPEVIAANARAVTAEEAAQLVRDHFAGRGSGHLVEELRALAPLPPSVVCVPVETKRRAEDALRRLLAEVEHATRDDSIPRTTPAEDGRAALAALTKVTR